MNEELFIRATALLVCVSFVAATLVPSFIIVYYALTDPMRFLYALGF